MEYCDKEMKRFRKKEFLCYRDGTLYYPLIHIPVTNDPPHFAKGGGPAAPAAIPGTEYKPDDKTIEIVDQAKYSPKNDKKIFSPAAGDQPEDKSPSQGRSQPGWQLRYEEQPEQKNNQQRDQFFKGNSGYIEPD